MSSRGGHRRRDRSWEREDRDRDRYSGRGRGGRSYHGEKRRSSRSRSPRRDRERDKDRDRKDRRDRDYVHKHDDDRRDGDRDRRDDKRREPHRRGDRSTPTREENYSRDTELKDRGGSRAESGPSARPEQSKGSSVSSTRPSVEVDPNTPEHAEDGEAMDATNDDEATMMAAMGLAGFGSTKGKHVLGNQEGASNVKKMRTWRQYMNRRGGFNRPLDKIK